MFWSKKKSSRAIEFDKEKQEAVLRCSICTGEQVAGIRDKESGHFTEVMLIRSQEDLKSFQEICGVDEVKKIY